MARREKARIHWSDDLRDAVVTLTVIALAFMAFDDITTDVDSDFRLEWSMLAGSAIWCGLLAWRLIRQGRGILGVLSFGAVALGYWGQRGIGTGTGSPWAYLAILLSLAWFLCVAALLAGVAWAARPKEAA